MFKAFKSTIGVVLGLIFMCVVISVLAYMASDGSQTSESLKEPSQENLVYQTVLNITGTGKDSTERFSLLGNDTKITFQFSGNQTCYGSSCINSYSALKLVCDGTIFDNLILNDTIAEINKTYNIKDEKGECYIEVDLNEGVAWNVNVEEKR